MQQQLAHLEAEVASLREGEFQQRYDTVRLMPLILSRMHIVPAWSQPTPSIHLNPDVLAPDGSAPLADGAWKLLQNDNHMRDVNLTHAHDDTNARVREVVTLPSGQTQEQPQPGTTHERPPQVKSASGLPTFDLPLPTATLPEGGLPGASLLDQLPSIPMIHPGQLPPTGSLEREQLEKRIDWYFDKLTLAANQALSADETAQMASHPGSPMSSTMGPPPIGWPYAHSAQSYGAGMGAFMNSMAPASHMAYSGMACNGQVALDSLSMVKPAPVIPLMPMPMHTPSMQMPIPVIPITPLRNGVDYSAGGGAMNAPATDASQMYSSCKRSRCASA